jgi:prepilin-type N-terminal cleavage/methylation domain-containing protein
MTHTRHTTRGFSLIELLITLSVIATLIGVLLPALRGARETSRTLRCGVQLRQLGLAWVMYANDFDDRAMPLAYTSNDRLIEGQPVYWWGTTGSATRRVDHTRGLIAPYLDAATSAGSVFECPNQPWGSYTPQGPASAGPTSTYGYNGYYLTPPFTPGYSDAIGSQRWKRISDIRTPTSLFIFADTMILLGNLRNCALLDPPQVYLPSWGWTENSSPTTAFRHDMRRSSASGATMNVWGSTVTARADGSVLTVRGDPAWMLDGSFLGSVTRENAPHYVPDAALWP